MPKSGLLLGFQNGKVTKNGLKAKFFLLFVTCYADFVYICSRKDVKHKKLTNEKTYEED